jgi:hypothetical protein
MIRKSLVGSAIVASALLVAPGAALADTGTPNPPFYCVGQAGSCGPAGDIPKKAEPVKSTPDKCDTPDFVHPPTLKDPQGILPDVTAIHAATSRHRPILAAPIHAP